MASITINQSIFFEPAAETAIYGRIVSMMQSAGEGFRIRKQSIQESFAGDLGRKKFDTAWKALIAKGYLLEEISKAGGKIYHHYSLAGDLPEQVPEPAPGTTLPHTKNGMYDLDNKIRDIEIRDIGTAYQKWHPVTEEREQVAEPEAFQDMPEEIYRAIAPEVRTSKHFRMEALQELVSAFPSDLCKILKEASRRFKKASIRRAIWSAWAYYYSIVKSIVRNWTTEPDIAEPAEAPEPEKAETRRHTTRNPQTRPQSTTDDHRAPQPDPRNKFNNFNQRNYDFASLESLLLLRDLEEVEGMARKEA